MTHFIAYWQSWLWSIGLLIGVIAVALVVHRIVFAVLRRMTVHEASAVDHSLVRHAEGPTRLIFPLIGVILALQSLPVRPDLIRSLRHLVGLGVIASVAWGIILVAEVLGDAVYGRYRVDVADNVAARRVRTQIQVLRRIFGIVVVFITVAIMLMTFPEIRQLGTSLLASAGLAGLVIGMAMKSTLSNLIAGVQIALTEPIRIDDVVIVGGEFGWIEEILTTYVVVRTWDLRRLVVPLTYFIENTFQNWTRQTADLLAYVYLYVDYSVPVEELRREFRRIVEASPLWDRKVCALQVSDASEHTIQVRALTSAADSSKAWDLRCEVREKLISFLQERYADALPKTRALVRGLPSDSPSGNGRSSSPQQFELAPQKTR
jgi:small-conductance mechanosensitive channel